MTIPSGCLRGAAQKPLKHKGDIMKETVNFTRFVDAFRDMGRQTSFSYEGKRWRDRSELLRRAS